MLQPPAPFDSANTYFKLQNKNYCFKQKHGVLKGLWEVFLLNHQIQSKTKSLVGLMLSSLQFYSRVKEPSLVFKGVKTFAPGFLINLLDTLAWLFSMSQKEVPLMIMRLHSYIAAVRWECSFEYVWILGLLTDSLFIQQKNPQTVQTCYISFSTSCGMKSKELQNSKGLLHCTDGRPSK